MYSYVLKFALVIFQFHISGSFTYLVWSRSRSVCLYDLHKVYDSVEYSILRKRLYEVGINSKCWRLIKAWYHQPKYKVKVDGRPSSSFVIERGVRQGSVLSPALFLIVMNPLLQRMQQLRLGATVHEGHLHMLMTSEQVPPASSPWSSR